MNLLKKRHAGATLVTLPLPAPISIQQGAIQPKRQITARKDFILSWISR
jgi:hypothetical protein